MLKRLFSSVDSGPSLASPSAKPATSSPTPNGGPTKQKKRAPQPYPLPNAPNDPPFCPRHDYFPASNAHVVKYEYGLPRCGGLCGPRRGHVANILSSPPIVLYMEFFKAK